MHILKARYVLTAGLLWAASASAAIAAQTPLPTKNAAPAVPPNETRSIAGEAASVPELVIAGRVVMRLRARAGGLTPIERAYDLRRRLGPILTLPNLSAEDIEVRQRRKGQTAFLYVRDRLLITVDRNLARANNTSVEGLAAQWARNLGQALPQVNVTVRMSGGFPITKETTTVPGTPRDSGAASAPGKKTV